VISLSNGIVSQSVLQSGEVITPYTLNAEMASAYYTGVAIPTCLTEVEAVLMGNGMVKGNSMLEQRVFMLNERAIELVKGLANFKTKFLSDVLSCRIFTSNYPLLIDHTLREANHYLRLLEIFSKDIQ